MPCPTSTFRLLFLYEVFVVLKFPPSFKASILTPPSVLSNPCPENGLSLDRHIIDYISATVDFFQSPAVIPPYPVRVTDTSHSMSYVGHDQLDPGWNVFHAKASLTSGLQNVGIVLVTSA